MNSRKIKRTGFLLNTKVIKTATGTSALFERCVFYPWIRLPKWKVNLDDSNSKIWELKEKKEVFTGIFQKNCKVSESWNKESIRTIENQRIKEVIVSKVK